MLLIQQGDIIEYKDDLHTIESHSDNETSQEGDTNYNSETKEI